MYKVYIGKHCLGSCTLFIYMHMTHKHCRSIILKLLDNMNSYLLLTEVQQNLCCLMLLVFYFIQ